MNFTWPPVLCTEPLTLDWCSSADYAWLAALLALPPAYAVKLSASHGPVSMIRNTLLTLLSPSATP